MSPFKILVIRRDNIGDLVCTTPAISAIRTHFPDAQIDVLVNDYNSDVLARNPDVDYIWAYRKGKHRAHGNSLFAIWLNTLRMMIKIRKMRYDIAIIATPSFSKTTWKFALRVGAKKIITNANGAPPANDRVTLVKTEGHHETEKVMSLLRPLGIYGTPGPCKVISSGITPSINTNGIRTIGIHISARKPSQRWPIERFAELAQRIHANENVHFLLFWSPGSADNPSHPGDDEKASRLLLLVTGLSLKSYATERLSELVEGIAQCDVIICSDGGAMHLAAGLGKPIVALFGGSDKDRWRPWRVPHVLLQKQSQNVNDISVEEVFDAYSTLTIIGKTSSPLSTL